MLETSQEYSELLDILKSQISDVDYRLEKLYDALETGAVEGSQLAPRITSLIEKKRDLERSRSETEENLRHQALEVADPKVIFSYVKHLKEVLDKSSLDDQKAFIRSFVNGVEVGEDDLTLLYTLPGLTDSQPLTAESTVLPIVEFGSRFASKGRTFSRLGVNQSRILVREISDGIPLREKISRIGWA